MENTKRIHISNLSEELNLTEFSDERRSSPLVNIAFSSVILSVMICCWALNFIVAKAVCTIGESRMPVKFLLLNALLGDVLLSISLGIREIFQMACIDDDQEDLSIAMLCINTVFETYNYFATFYQIFSSTALAFDRLYSILRPLGYHTTRYSLRQKIITILMLFLLSMGMSLPVVLLKITPGESLLSMCLNISTKGSYTEDILPYVIISSVLLTLFCYCTLFALVTYYRLKNETALGKGPEHLASRKRQMSLALTFFIIHITYVLLYLPGALYYSTVGYNLSISDEYHDYLAKIVILLYLSNTVLDPIIYMLRIKSIRMCVNAMFCNANSNRSSIGGMYTSEQETGISVSHLPTISGTRNG